MIELCCSAAIRNVIFSFYLESFKNKLTSRFYENLKNFKFWVNKKP